MEGRSGENDSAVTELGLRFRVHSRLTSGGPPPGGAQAGEGVWLSGEPYLLPSRPHQTPALISPNFMGPEIKRWRVREVKNCLLWPRGSFSGEPSEMNCLLSSETSGTLYQQGRLPALLQLLGLPLGGPCSVWRKARRSGIKGSRGKW